MNGDERVWRGVGRWFARAVLIVVAIAGVAAAVACGSSPATTPTVTPAPGYRGNVLAAPIPRPDFTLTDTSGAPFAFGPATRNRVTLLYFGYTNCPDICPTHMTHIATALRHLPANIASQVEVVFVTTDPARDTAPVLRAWLNKFDTHFIGLRGTIDEIHAAEQAAGEPLSTTEPPVNGQYAVSHAGWVIAFTKDNQAHVLYPAGTTTADWEHDLPLLVGAPTSGG